MAADVLVLDILTPRGPVRRDVAVPGIEVPGILGELGALPHHEPTLTAIVPGVVRFRQGDTDVRIAVGTGFLRLDEGGRASLLVDRACEAADVDVAATTAALKQVEARLADQRGSAIDAPEHRVLTEEQAWLEAQLRAARS